MLDKMTVLDLSESQLSDKRVLMRVDYNVPLNEKRQVVDDSRIRATLPTIAYLGGRGASIVLMSHLGRPKGEPVPELSLRPVASRLAALLESDVAFVPSTTSDEAIATTKRMKAGDIVLLENTRFDPGETSNDPEHAAALATLGDVFVNDAFGTAHRAHASTVGVAEHLRPAVAGLLMERELKHLGALLENPERPFVAVLGGAKVSGKIDLIENLLKVVDRLCVGGAMACTFFRALGHEIGTSLVEDELVGFAAELIERAGDALVLPSDVVVTEALTDGAESAVVARGAIPADRMVADIGPASAAEFAKWVGDARTILWNGPVGVFEHEAFSEGSRIMAGAIAVATDAGASSVVGGGDTAAAVAMLGSPDRVTHISTGGGATLEFLAGKELPGVAVLSDRSAP